MIKKPVRVRRRGVLHTPVRTSQKRQRCINRGAHMACGKR